MRAFGRAQNWTNTLGRIMVAVNNKKGRGNYSETAYKTMIGKIIIHTYNVQWLRLVIVPQLKKDFK